MRAELTIVAPGAPPRRVTLALGERLVVGRGEGASLRVADEALSREHVAVELGPAGLVVTDLGSRNGSLLAGQPLAPRAPTAARPLDELRAGDLVIELRLGAASAEEPRLRDEYERLTQLGQGGVGAVFHARHRATGREVAIKALLARVSDHPATRERLQREARVRIDSPHVVQVYEARVEGGQVYLVMELVRGRTLEALIAERGPLPAAEALALGHQVALGLAAAHAAGVVHRDLKPANVLVTAEGLAKLGDFGIAKVLGDDGLTRTGTGMGTLAYVAPEQAEDAKRVTPAADLYGLGATLYHALAGRPPFDPRDPRIIEKIFEDEPAPLARLRPDCPRALAALVHRLLEKDPDDRPPSAAAVAERLGALRAGGR